MEVCLPAQPPPVRATRAPRGRWPPRENRERRYKQTSKPRSRKLKNHHAARNSKLALAGCAGLRGTPGPPSSAPSWRAGGLEERTTSARNCIPCNNAAWLTTLFSGMPEPLCGTNCQPPGPMRAEAATASRAQTALSSNRTTREAQVLAQGSCSMSNSTVAVGSTARRKRNHEVSGTRRALSAGISPRSSTTMPKPPPCSSRSVTFNTCSRRPSAARGGWSLCDGKLERSLQRPHSRRSRSTPAATAEAGSKLSLASTSAHTSRQPVACASAASITPVRPEEAGPVISLSAPRGRPPVSASSAANPVETVSGAARWRSNSVEERCSPSEDSIRARSVATDGMRTSGGRSEYGAGSLSLFIRLQMRFCYGEPRLSTPPREPSKSGVCHLFAMRSSEFGGWEALLANPMVGRTISLLLGRGLFHVDARLRRSVPACIGTVIDAGVRVDPDLDIGVAQG